MIRPFKLLPAFGLLFALTAGETLLAASQIQGEVVNVGEDSLVVMTETLHVELAVEHDAQITLDGKAVTLPEIAAGCDVVLLAKQTRGIWTTSLIDARSPK